MYIFLEKHVHLLAEPCFQNFGARGIFFRKSGRLLEGRGIFRRSRGIFEGKERGVGEKWAAFWPEK